MSFETAFIYPCNKTGVISDRGVPVRPQLQPPWVNPGGFWLLWRLICNQEALTASVSSLCFQRFRMMQKTSLFPLLFFCLDAGLVQVIHRAQGSHSLAALWGGSVTRACLLTTLTLMCPSVLPLKSRSEGLQSILVLCFHFPVYTSLLYVLGQPTVEQLWGWHRWGTVGDLLFFSCDAKITGVECVNFILVFFLSWFPH